MKRINLATASRSLAEYAAELAGDVIVLTKGKRPVAALVPLKNTDSESLALSSHPEFMRLIKRSRRRFAAGKTLTLAQMRTRVRSMRRLPNQRLQPTRARAIRRASSVKRKRARPRG